MTTSRDEIERLLGGPLTPGLEALNPEDLDTLAEAIDRATREQESALATAVDNGLHIVPKVLRGTVRRALFG
ncbi:MAG TPA: hypothetical protein VLI04_19920 [Nocardioidaceae bacterium]|nr:hypothetical protein [Nocardioidaceae bacterium]